MARQLTEHDGRIALRDHVEQKALEARQRFGPVIDADAIARMLDDQSVVRYPVGVRFDVSELEAGEFAWPAPLGDRPERGYCLFVHPALKDQSRLLALAIAYYIPEINYGAIVTSEEAELFGATLHSMDRDAYYRALCDIADRVCGP